MSNDKAGTTRSSNCSSVGRTEEELKQAGIAYKKGVFPFSANGRARALAYTEGQVKVLARADTDRVVGVHIIGPRAGDLIAEAAVSIGGSNLPAGVYGFGTSPDGKFNVMNMAGEQVLTVATETDSAVAHPVPLTMSEDGGKYRLYLGRKHVTISR